MGEKGPKSSGRLDLRCIVNGEDIQAQILQFLPDGALFKSARPLKSGDLLLIYPSLGPERPLAAVLMAKVAAVPDQFSDAYAMQLLKCVVYKGFDLLHEILTGHLGYAPDRLPHPAQEMMANQRVGYDFVTRSFFLPAGKERPGGPRAGEPTEPTATTTERTGRQPTPMPTPLRTGGPSGTREPSDTSYSLLPGTKEDTGVIRARGGTDPSLRAVTAGQPSSLPGSASEQPRPDAGTEAVRVTPPPRPIGTPAAGEPARIPTPTPVPFKAIETEQPLASRLLVREKSRLAVKLPVTYKLNRKMDQGVIRALGTSTLLLATGLEVGPASGTCEVLISIPNQREPVTVRLICNVDAFDEGKTFGYPAVDLNIIKTDQGGRPGIFERYVRALFYKMTGKKVQ